MATNTQYNPNEELNAFLRAHYVSKTVYALVTPETEIIKAITLGNQGDAHREAYLDQFRAAWTAKQDALHEDFFSTWHAWSSRSVNLDRKAFPFYYPTAGASEALRHLIYDFAAKRSGEDATIHFFEGEYEGYKAMAEAADLPIQEHKRDDWKQVVHRVKANDLFFLSQPSAIDGNVWADANAFIQFLRPNTLVLDLTYVGAVPFITEIDCNAPSVRNVVFSLSKPFGAYYDRVGGVWCRKEDLGLFGNKWFKNLTSLSFGVNLMKAHDVLDFPTKYRKLQQDMTADASGDLGFEFTPSDVFILATAKTNQATPLATYLRRAGKLRICLTPGMAEALGTAGV